MKHCVSCGHELGVGRFCTNCGHPIGRAPTDAGWRTDTAERPAVSSAPRFPLFADEVEEPPSPSGPPYAEHRRPRPPWGMWAWVVLALVVFAALGIWLLAGGDDPDPDDRPGTADAARTAPAQSSSASSAPDDETPEAADPSDVGAGATVEAPATAPPGQDVSGNPVDYEAANMLDGVAETTWRMPGDGSGDEIVLTLPEATHLRSVGLINGYAKSATDPRGRELDWYHGNRRVESVEWVFDDGTTISQDLQDTRDLQSVDVDVTTTTVRLRLVTVSAPGVGRAARDYTAISDVSLVRAG